MDDYRRAYLMRMWAALFAGVPFAALMVTVWPGWPWWMHSIGALVIWTAAIHIVFKLWAMPDRPPS